MTTVEAVGGPFDFGRVIQRTFRVVGEDFGPLMLWALILVSAPGFVITLLALGATDNAAYLALYGFGGSLLALIGAFVLQGVVVHTVIARLNGTEVGIGAALGVGARFLLPLIGLAIISTLAIMVGMLFLLVPALILMTIWSVASPSLVAEERGVFESLQRSRDLTRGHRWSIFGLLVVYFILSMIIGTVTQVLSATTGVNIAGGFSVSKMAALTPMLVVVTLVSAAINGLQGVIGAAGAASLYYELRTTKEGVAPDQLASVFD